jgi:hypothetical protein
MVQSGWQGSSGSGWADAQLTVRQSERPNRILPSTCGPRPVQTGNTCYETIRPWFCSVTISWVIIILRGSSGKTKYPSGTCGVHADGRTTWLLMASLQAIVCHTESREWEGGPCFDSAAERKKRDVKKEISGSHTFSACFGRWRAYRYCTDDTTCADLFRETVLCDRNMSGF